MLIRKRVVAGMSESRQTVGNKADIYRQNIFHHGGYHHVALICEKGNDLQLLMREGPIRIMRACEWLEFGIVTAG